jgi:dTDP-4-dehydrorhamnose reductase
VDITDPRCIDEVLGRVEPWAVINAAGYVRVDDAEYECGACRLANVEGAVNLAAACRRYQVPLVTFSSDLVFDGALSRPYVEQDEPKPLNVYGATKAEADRRVLQLLPRALVIRTSAFFGPWDESNFLAVLFRSLDGDRPFAAAADMTVSPTYVPDLAEAALDLLIDGESGLWHIANPGEATWFEFARTAAMRSGRRSDLVVAVDGHHARGIAPRPRYSALGSARGVLLRPLDDALEAFLTHPARAPLHVSSPA